MVLFGAMKCNTSHLYQVHYTYAVFCNRENFTVYKKKLIFIAVRFLFSVIYEREK